ncbi:MAG: hypothetical protein AB8G99_12625 [Planctomycetaceae bacterium]
MQTLAMMVLLTCSGCNLFGRRSAIPTPITARQKPALPYQISQAELVEHLNTNSDRVHSWMSRDCGLSIRTPVGLPIRLKATIACEEPRNFRLVADGSLMAHADIGSNEDHCWWWMQPGENVIFTVPHSEMDYVRNHPFMKKNMSMPFEPDWLMEVLGVTKLSAENMTMHRDSHPERVNLVSEHHSPDGRMFRRVTVVDLHGGHIVGHRMVDSSNHTIARATLSDFQFKQGAKLPGKIALDWPTMDMSMTFTIRNLSVNGQLQPNLWNAPADKSVTHVSLPDQLRRQEQSGHQFQQMELQPNDRPRDRPLYDQQVQGVSATDDSELPWEDDPPKRRKWFRFPWSKN